MKTELQKLIERLVEVATPRCERPDEVALWCYGGMWSASVGGHSHVMLGEWPGDFYTKYNVEFETPEEAIRDLIGIVEAK